MKASKLPEIHSHARPLWVFFALFVVSLVYCYVHGWIIGDPLKSWVHSSVWSLSLWLPWLLLALILMNCQVIFKRLPVVWTVIVLACAALLLKIGLTNAFSTSANLLASAYRHLPFEVLVAAIMTYLHLNPGPVKTKAVTDRRQTNPVIQAYQGTHLRNIKTADVVCICSADNYVEIHTMEHVYIKRATLSAMFQKLKSHGFIQTHRGTLVNQKAIVTIKKSASGHHTVLRNGLSLRISRNRRQQVAERLRCTTGEAAP